MQLPAELVSLIHHIELNQAGWWDKALQRFLIGAAAEVGPTTTDELSTFVRETYGLPLDSPVLERHVSTLVGDGDFVLLPTGEVKLSEATTKQVTSDVSRAQEQRGRLKAKLHASLQAEGVTVDPEACWTQFESDLLTPLVAELGARTYELLVARTVNGSTPNLQDLLGRASEQFGDDFRRAIVAFLDPTDPEVRAYVLRALNAYFFSQASAVDERVLTAIDKSREKHSQVRILLDTNFLFSILRLHDNPSNEVAEALDDLLGRVRERVGIRLYVLPNTVDEVRAVLRWHMSALAGVRPPPNVAQAVVERPELSGLTKRYLMAAAQSDRVITAEDFFGLYESAPLTVLRERGVELFNENLDPYRTRQDVVDDVVDEEAFQRAHRARGPKNYETILHDVILWHVVDDKRPRATDSPLDVGYWIVTEDWRFVGFDRWKRHDRGYAICLTPASLMQLLQFWLPRTEELDRALVGSIRLPFLLEDFDKDAERVTTRILRSLSKYEGIEGLSIETVSDILMSDALRTRLERTPDEADDDVLLRDAFVERTAELERELAVAQAQAVEARGTAVDSEERAAVQLESQRRLERELRELREATREAELKLSRELEEARKQREQEESVRRTLETNVQALQNQLSSSAAKRRFVLVAMGLLVIAAGIGIGSSLALLTTELPAWIAVGLGASIGLGCWLAATGYIGSRSDALRGWSVHSYLSLSGYTLLKLVGVLAVGVVASLIAALLGGDK